MEGGVNTRFSLHALLQNELADMQNFHLEARGGVEKRKGYRRYHSGHTASGNEITGLWQHKSVDGDFLMKVENGDVFKDGGSTWDDITGTETLSVNPNDLVIAEVFRKNSIFTDGVNPILKWSGTGNVAKAAQSFDASADVITTAYTLVRHRERIVLGDISTDEGTGTRYESGIWGSTAGTLDTWIDPATESGRLFLGEGDGDSITNLQDILGFLVVFKQRSMFRVSDFGASTVETRRVSGSVGCPGKHAAIVVGTFVYFLDSTGRFYRYDVRGDNEDTVEELSANKLGVPTTSTFVRDRLPFAVLYHDEQRDEILCFFTDTQGTLTETNVAWVFNIQTGGFAPFRYANNFNIVAQTIDAQDEPLFVGGTYDGKVMKSDDTDQTDDGTTITAFITLRHVDAGNLAIVKGYRYIHVYTSIAESQNLTVTHFHDFESAGDQYTVPVTGGGDLLDTTFILDTSTLAGPGESMERQRLIGWDRWTQLRVEQAEDKSLKILGILLLYKTSSVHRGAIS